MKDFFLIGESKASRNVNLNERRTAWIPHVTNVLIRNVSMVTVGVVVTDAQIP